MLVVEKEDRSGRHASGRNSGVLHSGIYYPGDSLKARVCAEGAREMAEYCDNHGLPILRVGKVIVPSREEDDAQVDLLYHRACLNRARVELVDEAHLREIEPEARTATGRALYSPDTAVVDPVAILDCIRKELERNGVKFRYGLACVAADPQNSSVVCGSERIGYGHLFNATGAYADRIAKMFGGGRRYMLLPFKGRYLKLRADSGVCIRGLIYPVPNLDMPFLGVHSVKSITGEVYFGPSAMPAFGRENYRGFEDVDMHDVWKIVVGILVQYRFNHQGFRRLMHEETQRLFPSGFSSAARRLVPRVKRSMLVSCNKVGIRPQLVDTESHRLVTDFLVEAGENSTHVLNAISPAFTSAFSFARLVVDESSCDGTGRRKQ